MDEATLQALRERPQETVRVPLDEIRRTLCDLDRQHAEERARRREGDRLQTASGPQPRGGKVMLPPEEVARTLGGLDHQHTEEITRRRRAARPQEVLESETRNGKLRVPLEEIVRVSDGLARQRAEDRQTHQFRWASQTHQAHQDGSARRGLQGAGATELVQRPSTPESTFPPQTPPSRKRRSAQQEGLLTPPPSGQGRRRKKPRLLHEAAQLQQRSLDAILQHRETCFHAKKDASEGRSWCKEVPLTLQVETSKSFYEAFTDERTLSVSHCSFCYRRCPPAKLTIIQWRKYLTSQLLQATAALQKCEKCLPSDGDSLVDVCLECRGGFERGKLPKACSVNNMDIGCEHRYPKELDGLSPLEERLIALQAPFGYITKFTVDNKTPSGASYRKHVKGHIVVFPNNVEDLVATVLPHPLLQTIENIHVSWSGANRPSPRKWGRFFRCASLE